jgi:hypothetical protein
MGIVFSTSEHCFERHLSFNRLISAM